MRSTEPGLGRDDEPSAYAQALGLDYDLGTPAASTSSRDTADETQPRSYRYVDSVSGPPIYVED